MTLYNYTGAFLAWCRGAPLEEVSALFGIPIGALQKRKRKEKWEELAHMAPNAIVPAKSAENMHVQRCLENREKNLKIAEKLREDVTQVLDGLLKGKKMKRYWQFQGRVIEHEVDWNMQDRVALANYMTMVANLTYRALGDREAASTADTSDRPGGSPSPVSITMVLPGAIANPRDIRPGDKKAGVVVDLDKAFGQGAQRTGGDGDGAPPGGSRFEMEEELERAQIEGIEEPAE